MKRLNKWILGAGVALVPMTLCMSSSVIADELESNNNYMQVKLGLVQPLSDLDDAGYDTGYNGALSYGRYLTDFLILEGSLDLSAVDTSSKTYNSVAGNYTQDSYLVTEAFLLTLKGEHHLGPVDIYGGGGVGLYGVLLDADIESDKLGDFSVDDTDTVFGVHLVAGFNYNINERFFVGLEGMYRWTDDVELSETAAAIPVNFEGDLSGYTVTLNTGFRF